MEAGASRRCRCTSMSIASTTSSPSWASVPIEPLTPDQLFPFDQFHYHGIDAVRAAAGIVGLGRTSRVLEVGSGLGGPARYLAHTVGCHVTALELQEELHDLARTLTRPLRPRLARDPRPRRCVDISVTRRRVRRGRELARAPPHPEATPPGGAPRTGDPARGPHVYRGPRGPRAVLEARCRRRATHPVWRHDDGRPGVRGRPARRRLRRTSKRPT